MHLPTSKFWMRVLGWPAVTAALWSGAVFAGSKTQKCQAECEADVKECVDICLNPNPEGKGDKGNKGDKAEKGDKHAGAHSKVKVTPAVCKKLCADMAQDCKQDCE